jgi:hypothetical protein
MSLKLARRHKVDSRQRALGALARSSMNAPHSYTARVELYVSTFEHKRVQEVSGGYVGVQLAEISTLITSTSVTSNTFRNVLNPLVTIKQNYSGLLEGKIDLTTVLKKYALTERFEEAIRELSNFVDLSQLAAILAWLEESLEDYRLEGFTLLKDPEFNEPLTVAIHIGGCDFEEWRTIVKSIKQKLLEEGFSDLAGKVTIVCIDVFRRTS